jgi:cytochrome c biogenesis protein CcmG/thiol:disulfide interchange protein DsbE
MNHLIANNKTLFLLATIITLCFSACIETEPEIGSKVKTAEASVAVASSEPSSEQELIDAPDFTLEKMNGEPFTLSDHEGQVVVLNIWATWCPPCREEIPDFIEIQHEMRDEGVLFVGVSMDKEGWEVVRPFAQEYNINYPIVVDDGTVSRKYGPFRAVPTTFIINKKGKVAYVALGMLNKATLKPVLEKLAKE